jgi:hypothetical protein
MNVAVGFNPRQKFLRDALVAERRLNRRVRKGAASVVATRLVGMFAIAFRGLKPTATFSSRYAAKTRKSESHFGPRCYRCNQAGSGVVFGQSNR